MQQQSEEELPEVEYCISFPMGTVAHTTNLTNVLFAQKILIKEYPDLVWEGTMEAWVR